MTAWRALVRLLAWAPLHRRVGLFVLMLLASASEGVGVLLMVPLLGALQGEAAGPGSALVHGAVQAVAALGLPVDTPVPLLVLFCVLVVLRNLVQYARERAAARLQHDVAERLRATGFAALLGAQWRWLVAQRSADQAHLMLTDINRIGVGLAHGMLMMACLVSVGAYLLAAFALTWKLALVSVLTAGPLLALLAGRRRGVLSLGRQLTVAGQRLQASLQDSLAGLRLAKILGAEARYQDWIQRDARALSEQQLRFASALGRSKALMHSAGAILLALYVYLGLQVWQVPLAELLAMVLVFARLLPLLATAQQQQQYWLHALPAFTEAERQLAQSRAWAEPAMLPGTAPLQLHQSMVLQAVQVRYAGRDAPALQGVSLCLKARSTTAIVGASGAGKSTLADVLCGLLGPDEGVLEIDGVPLDAQRRCAWRRSVAYVSQDSFLLNDSIRNNLLLAAPQADEAALHTALEQASAQFVHGLPQGLETVVGDRGAQLSGGERQRLALARALLQRPALLILDEATSALDHDNEARIRAAIDGLHGELTVVIIGHRLALLERADSVVLLEQGRVRVQGPWSAVAPAWRQAPP